MNKNLEFRTFSFSIKKADEVTGDGIIKGYASTFGNIDLGLDVVERGAFAKTIRESNGKFPILADHDPRKQIGWNLNAKEDSKGLDVEGELDIANNAKAKERFSLSKKALAIGAKAGLSIGFMTIQAEPDPENPRIRILKELKLFEYSMVTFPMNTEAMVEAAKSWHSGGNDNIQEAMDFFINALVSKGFSKQTINRALLGAAAKSGHPDHSIQCLTDEINKLRGALK